MNGRTLKIAIALAGMLSNVLAFAAGPDPGRSPQELIEGLPAGETRVLASVIVENISEELLYPKNVVRHVATYYSLEETRNFLDWIGSAQGTKDPSGTHYLRILRLADPETAVTVAKWLRSHENLLTGEGTSKVSKLALEKAVEILETKDVQKSDNVEKDWPPIILEMAATFHRRQGSKSNADISTIAALTKKQFQLENPTRDKAALINTAGNLNDPSLISSVMAAMPKQPTHEKIDLFDTGVRALASMHLKEADEKVKERVEAQNSNKYDIYTSLLNASNLTADLDLWLGEQAITEWRKPPKENFSRAQYDFQGAVSTAIYNPTKEHREHWASSDFIKDLAKDPEHGTIVTLNWLKWDSDDIYAQVARILMDKDLSRRYREAVYRRMIAEWPELSPILEITQFKPEAERMQTAVLQLIKKSHGTGISAVVKEQLEKDLQKPVSVPDPEGLDAAVQTMDLRFHPEIGALAHQRLLRILPQITAMQFGWESPAMVSCNQLAPSLMLADNPQTVQEFLGRVKNLNSSSNSVEDVNNSAFKCLTQAAGKSKNHEVHAALLKIANLPDAPATFKKAAILALSQADAHFPAKELDKLFWSPDAPVSDIQVLYPAMTGKTPTQEDWLGALINSNDSDAVRAAVFHLLPETTNGQIQLDSLQSREKSVSVRAEIRNVIDYRLNSLTPASVLSQSTDSDANVMKIIKQIADSKNPTRSERMRAYDVILASGLTGGKLELKELTRILADESNPEKLSLRVAAAEAIGAIFARSGNERLERQPALATIERLREELQKQVNPNVSWSWVKVANAAIRVKDRGSLAQSCSGTFPSLTAMEDVVTRRIEVLKIQIQGLSRHAGKSLSRTDLKTSETLVAYDPKSPDREKGLGIWQSFDRLLEYTDVQDRPYHLLLSQTRNDYIHNHSIIDTPYTNRTGSLLPLGARGPVEGNTGKALPRGIFERAEIDSELQSRYVEPYMDFFRIMNAEMNRRMAVDFPEADRTDKQQAHQLLRAAETELALQQEVLEKLQKSCTGILEKLAGADKQKAVFSPPADEMELDPNEIPKLLEPPQRNCP